MKAVCDFLTLLCIEQARVPMRRELQHMEHTLSCKQLRLWDGRLAFLLARKIMFNL